jgi:hypothetical protein
MSIVTPDSWIVAEMITHEHVWHGAGVTCDEAREALLRAWTVHRRDVLRQQPGLAGTLPEAPQMPQHFKIRYREYRCGAGYRDDQRLA